MQHLWAQCWICPSVFRFVRHYFTKLATLLYVDILTQFLRYLDEGVLAVILFSARLPGLIH